MNAALSESLLDFFNKHHDKLLCTSNRLGEPNISLMGTPRLMKDGTIEFEISDVISKTLDNIKENKHVVFMAYSPGVRARDFTGARIYADVTDIQYSGEKLEGIRRKILERHGPEKAAELQATLTCVVTNVRPVVDRGQYWNEPPFEEG